MNLDNVSPIPVVYTDSVNTAMDLALSGEVTRRNLLKQFQNICIVYSCLGIKRNAGVKSTADKYREACRAFREVTVPGFFRWARDYNRDLPAWLTIEKMGCTTMQSGPILFNDGKKLWSKFDKAMREMKRDFNPIWDRYVRGQPGGNLPSGQTGDDAIENLLDGLHALTVPSVGNPRVVTEVVDTEAPTSSGDAENATGVSEASQEEDVTVGGRESREQGVTSGVEEVQEQEQDKGNDIGAEAEGASIDSSDRSEDGGNDSTTEGNNDNTDNPPRPTGWLHEFLLIYCLIGRPSDSEDPDLQAARKTSGPSQRPAKRKSTGATGDDNSDRDSMSSGSLGNFDSTTIRTFVGAGEAQSRAKIKRERALVAQNAAHESYRQKRLQQSENLITAVETLTTAAVARQKIYEEVAARNRDIAARDREVAARNRKMARIADMKGQLELLPQDSPPYLAIRAAILTLYQTPDSAFMQASVAVGTPPSPPMLGTPPTGSAAFTAAPPTILPGFAGGAASCSGTVGGMSLEEGGGMAV